MQSILSNTNKTPLSEVNSETKAVEKLTNDEGEELSDKDSLRFSDVLGSFIEGSEEAIETKLATGEFLETTPEAEDQVLPVTLSGEDSLTDNVEDDSSLALNGLGMSEPNDDVIELDVLEGLQEPIAANNLPTPAKLSLENEDLSKDSKHDAVISETEDDLLLSEVANLRTLEKAVNPMITQIEGAQKTNTQVKEAKSQAVGALDAELKKIEKESLKSFKKGDKLTFENVLADEPDKLGKDLFNKDNLLNAFKADLNKPVLNHNLETNVVNTLAPTSSSTDRLVNQASAVTPSPLLQTTALQQPLELQAKHASAMIGERILMMLRQGKQEVTIRLDPAELGSMHIKLQVQQDQLQVTIQTQVGQSRDIIEQNLPRLREQLAQQGINLAEANVEQKSNQQQSNSHDSKQSNSTIRQGDSTGDTSGEDQSEWLATQIPLPAQGIDYYA